MAQILLCLVEMGLYTIRIANLVGVDFLTQHCFRLQDDEIIHSINMVQNYASP